MMLRKGCRKREDRLHSINQVSLTAEESRNTPPMVHQVQQLQDNSFNLTGIVPPQPPKWKQVDHLNKDF